MDHLTPYRILVVGGGFSGAVVAIQLLLRSKNPICITIIDRAGSPGRGVAYSSLREEHVLNVKAGSMSAIPDDTGHFVRWLKDTGLNIGAEDFAARHLYGAYINSLFEEVRSSCGKSSIFWITGEAISLTLEDLQPQILLGDETALRGDVVVLATGNAPPALPIQMTGFGEELVAPYAWKEAALTGIPDSGSVLILGSGLTAIDQVLSLHAQGFRGRITLLSRRGKLPATHAATPITWSDQWTETLPPSLLLITARLRREIELARAEGVDWRSVVDSLRPVTPKVWQSLSLKDRRRFLRHLKSFWETSRHRVPEKTTAVLNGLKERGRLSIVAGALLHARKRGDLLMVSFQERGTGLSSVLAVHRVINCIGPGFTPRHNSPLIDQLLNDQIARLDPVGLGIETTPDGALVSGTGAIVDVIYCIGPVRKACLWETTSVREIREQACLLADLILDRVLADSRLP